MDDPRKLTERHFSVWEDADALLDPDAERLCLRMSRTVAAEIIGKLSAELATERGVVIRFDVRGMMFDGTGHRVMRTASR